MCSEELTIMWINGELPDGWYYIELKDTVMRKELVSMKDGYTIAYLRYIQYPHKKVAKANLLFGCVGYKSIKKIVAKVPTNTEVKNEIH